MTKHPEHGLVQLTRKRGITDACRICAFDSVAPTDCPRWRRTTELKCTYTNQGAPREYSAEVYFKKAKPAAQGVIQPKEL